VESKGSIKSIAFRADIDALHMSEENKVDYISQTNYAHTCGHDGHTASLILFAAILIKI